MHHDPCFNLFILHSNPFENEGSEINKSDIFLRFDNIKLIEKIGKQRKLGTKLAIPSDVTK